MSVVKDIYTVREAARILGVSDSRVRQLALHHKIGTLHGGARLFDSSEIERLKAIPRVMGRPRKTNVA